jgi:hypothetical protein
MTFTGTTKTLEKMRHLRSPTALLLSWLIGAAAGFHLSTRPTAKELDAAKTSGAIALWDSASPCHRKVDLWELRLFFPQRTDRDMQQQLGLRGQRDADNTNAAIAAVIVSSAVLSNLLLGVDGNGGGDPIRQAAGLLACGVPFATLAAGVLLPGAVRTALVSTWRVNPAYRKRQAYHEAGHLLVGYLCGLEVESAVVAGENADSAVGFVGSGASVGRGEATLDKLACVSMAGIAAEVLGCGNAEGGTTDVAGLRVLMERALPPLITRRAQDERIRWATLMALTLLQQQRASLDALATAFDERADVRGCVRAIEGAKSAACAGPGGAETSGTGTGTSTGAGARPEGPSTSGSAIAPPGLASGVTPSSTRESGASV